MLTNRFLNWKKKNTKLSMNFSNNAYQTQDVFYGFNFINILKISV